MGNKAELVATGIAFATLTLAAGAACGGDGGSDASTQDPTRTTVETQDGMPSWTAPVTDAPTATAVPPTETPLVTPEITAPPTPEVNSLDLVNKNITLIENLPLPEGVNPNAWESSKFTALEGLDDQGGNSGLYDIRSALENGDRALANQMLTDDLFMHFAGFASPNSNNTIVLTKDEINGLDPENLLISSGFNSILMITYTKDVALDMITLKYSLQS